MPAARGDDGVDAGFGCGDYGDDRTQTMVALVAAANHIADPDHIEAGQVIFFPSFD